MADKTWTAVDVELGKITFYRSDDELHAEARYGFVDTGGAALGQVAGGRVLVEVPIASIPADILSALVTIRAWLKEQALEQEGMVE